MIFDRKALWLAAFLYISGLALIADAEQINLAAKVQFKPISNHSFFKVAQCEHDFVDINFCSKKYVSQFRLAIKNKKPDFNLKYIFQSFNITGDNGKLLGIGAAVIDSTTGVVYILPFETYSGNVDNQGREVDKPIVEYDLNQNNICFKGSTYGYRQVNENTVSCYKFDESNVVNGSNFIRIN